MPARPKGPWFRKGRGWFCFIDGVRYNLKTKDRAVAWDSFYRLMGEAGKAVDADDKEPPSVMEVLERFCDWAEKHRKPHTSAFYDLFLKGFLKHAAYAKTTAAVDLKPFQVQQWIDARPKWSTTTQNRAAAAVKRAYSWAVEQGLIATDPIRPLKKAKSRRRLRILTAEEWTKVLERSGPALRDFLDLQRMTGARPQELRAAEVRHYDQRQGVIRFPADESKGGIQRDILLPAAADVIVRRAIGKRDSGPILLNSSGCPWTRAGLRMAWRRLVTSSGVHFDAYTLRHTFATEALVRGVDSLTVGVLMGHVDPSMVGRIYSHLDQKPKYLKEAAEKAVRVRTASKRKGAPGKKKPPATGKARKPAKKASARGRRGG